MLIDQIRTARITAMKERDAVAKTILTTLLGELEGMAKREQADITDEMVAKTCKKFVASNQEVIALDSNVEQLTAENVILTKFIPIQLTADELRVIIVDMNASNLGEIMKQLKADHNGEYDGKTASTIAREVLG